MFNISVYIKKEATDNITSKFIYDLFTADNLLCEVARYANGESSSNVYDKFGRLKYVYSADISAGADDSKKTEYKYDIKGRRESIAYPNGAKTTYEYYNNNNVKTLVNYIQDKTSEEQFKEIEKYEYSYYDNNTMSGKKETYDGVLQG